MKRTYFPNKKPYNSFLATAIASLVIGGCGGGSGGNGGGGNDVAPKILADLQGTWVSQVCEVEDIDQSAKNEISISGTTAIQTVVLYINSSNCSGNLSINTNVTSTISTSGATTTVSTGDAKHLDISLNRAYITASDAALAALESEGTTLQDAFTAQGIPDIDNVPLSSLFDAEKYYSIYQVSQNTLRIGESTELNNGTSAASRHTTLESETYIRQ